MEKGFGYNGCRTRNELRSEILFVRNHNEMKLSEPHANTMIESNLAAASDTAETISVLDIKDSGEKIAPLVRKTQA